MSIGSLFADSTARVTLKFDAPAVRQPLEFPMKEKKVVADAPPAAIEQFSGPVEVLQRRREEAATAVAEPEKPCAEVEQSAREPRYSTFQIVPHAEVKNDKIGEFADLLEGTYRELYQRWTGGFELEDPDRLFFETVMTPEAYRTYITTNTPMLDMVKQHADQTWRRSTSNAVTDPFAEIDPVRSAGFEMRLERPSCYSLSTDRRMQEKPLAQLMALSRSMADDDAVYLQFGFQASEDTWGNRAEELRGPGDCGSASQMKPAAAGYDFTMRVVVASSDARRRRRLCRGVELALRQLNGDNRLVPLHSRRWRLKRLIANMRRRHLPVSLREKRRQILTAAEIAHFIKLPQRALQEEYRQLVDNVSKPEVSLPGELFMSDVPGIDIGEVIEKGVKRTARVPLKAFGQTKQKYVDDAYCMPEFVFGEMGSGKTGEAIHRAHSSIVNGQTAFFFDSADGAACRELHDSLPADYPEEKIIHIDLTNKAWPVALRWAFAPSPSSGGDAELEAEEAREKGRMFLRQFVAGMATSEFTDRMERYLSAAARGAGAAPLDLELALTSPSYREELLSRPEIAEQQDIVADLTALQEKAKRGSESSTVEGILSRLRLLGADRFRANLFYQEPKETLDFRRYADNPEGGYGYCVTIYCDKNSYGADGQEAILTYLFAKVLLEAGYSRVDIEPAARKPFVIELDEPHRFIKGDFATKLGEDAAVELRKYRVKLAMFGHSRSQIGKLWDAFESGGVQVTMYKSKNVQAFRDMAAVIAPLDPEQAWASLGQHEAVVTRKLPSKQEVSFICKMAAPPAQVKDRSVRRETCARQFGRPWKEVRDEIQNRRAVYAAKDAVWLAERTDEEAERKEAVKEAKKAQREAKKAA